METKTVKAYGNYSAEANLNNLSIKRRKPGAHDVEIEILYCGVCHSDLHTARSEWGPTMYPCVPGHEIIGKITSLGVHVANFKLGDVVGVGCIVDSCRDCEYCKEGLEQYCESGMTWTYNSQDKNLIDTHTFGGYSESMVVDEKYLLRIPENLDLAAVAPLLCAGITTYSPLRHWGISQGKTIGIVGIGGLGHMGIKLAKAMGAKVIAFTTSEAKFAEARRLGADDVVLSSDSVQMAKYNGKLHFILDAVSAVHDVNTYLSLLRVDGTLALIGLPEQNLPIAPFSVVGKRISFAGSMIGGIKETQEMLNFCGEKNITADIEMINIQDINQAFERLLKGDVKYRFVIDMQSLKN